MLAFGGGLAALRTPEGSGKLWKALEGSGRFWKALEGPRRQGFLSGGFTSQGTLGSVGSCLWLPQLDRVSTGMSWAEARELLWLAPPPPYLRPKHYKPRVSTDPVPRPSHAL